MAYSKLYSVRPVSVFYTANMPLEQEKDVMLAALDEAGKVVMKFFTEKNFEIKHKSIGNPVTEADLAANDILSQAIRDHFSQDLILSEETYEQDKANIDRQRKTAERIWVIDPIDGTKEFVEGIPHFAISVALVVHNKPCLGFIYNPAQDFLIWGGSYHPLSLNGNSIKRSPAPSALKDVKVCLSRSEHKKNLFEFLKPHVHIDDKQIIGSVAYKLGLVAAGTYDLIISKKPKNEWDIAGGMALFQALQYPLYDEFMNPILLNKDNLISQGLVGGDPRVIELYKQKI